MGASARARRHRWRALVIAALPCALLVTTTANAAPPTDPSPSLSATPLPPSSDPSPPPGTDPTDPASTAPAANEPAPAPTWTANALSPTDVATGTKAPTSRLAHTDAALLGRTDATPLQVVVKLDYDSVATYAGTIDGLAPTSPSVTGTPLTTTSSAERSYTSYIVTQERTFEQELAAAVPDATVVQSLRTVYGGVAVTLPANRIGDVVALPGVVAVQDDQLHQPLTDSSPSFIGADTLYPALGGDRNAGKGTIIGVLDTGSWPEHPSYADQGNLGAPPPKKDGTPRTCNFGDNPLTPAADVFACNHKLIGGRPFLATYNSDPARRAAEPFPNSARDSNGHGTHTSTTAAGEVVASAAIFGVDRGPIHGIAPGAWISVYKVCGIEGCFDTDSVAAVQQAILDGVDVINFSISGGSDPFSDPVELAFLDAYAAGVFVAASAGNSGPGAGTSDHGSPWVTTVAASTQQREFRSTLTVTGADGATATFTGASITAGVAPALPVIAASAAPYSDARCTKPAAPGTFTGKIVACERGTNGRAEKGFNVKAGGAAGMILYNLPPITDVETDNHFLPVVHLADGTALLAFLGAHPGTTASFTQGVKAQGVGDVMASFSSRGPTRDFLKPDITAPGVQILAGNTPVPDEVAGGPPGEYYQAIAGTSMSSPHIAGAALLLAALKPDWTPGQIKSALMTTAWQQVVKEDGKTKADPFDDGAGRVDLSKAGRAGLAFDETADNMATLGSDSLTKVNLNVPSIYATAVPGRLTTTRTATNVTDRRQRYTVSAKSPAGATITVSPKQINLAPGDAVEISVTITTNEGISDGWHFGELDLAPRTSDVVPQHLPIAFQAVQGDVTLGSACVPESILVKSQTTECTVTAQNNTFDPTTVDLSTTVSKNLRVVAARGASLTGNRSVAASASLAPKTFGVPSVAPGTGPAGYIPLDAFGVSPVAIGDEQILNFNVPGFVYNGVTYSRLGIDSNGYLVAGGGTASDNECCNLPDGPSAAPPNDILAPFWTDLDGTGAPGILAATLTDGTDSWIVIEWRVNVFGTTSRRTFQVWIGFNGTQDVSFAYPPSALPGTPTGQLFLVGAENEIGQGDMEAVLPTGDRVVTSTDPKPGGVLTYRVVVRGQQEGPGEVTTEMVTPAVDGVTVVRSEVDVTR